GRGAGCPGGTPESRLAAPRGEHPVTREPIGPTGPGVWITARLGAGGWSAVPSLAVLAVVWIVFQIANPSFLSSANLVNLAMQSAATGLIALGVVFVLIVGQIDLSVGAVASLAGAIVGILFVGSGWPAIAAILAALVVAAGIGALYGLVVIRFRAPGFV